MKLKISQAIIIGILAAVASASAAQQSAKDFDLTLFMHRNIFDPNRIEITTNHPPVRPPIVDTFALTGTMSYDDGLFAWFEGNNTAYNKVVQDGGKIAGYTVSNITFDSATLVQDTNEVLLKVGMQMRRSANGSWAASEMTGNTFASSSGNSRFGNFDFGGRNNRSRNSRFGGGNNFGRNDFQNRFQRNGFGNGFENGGGGEMTSPETTPTIPSGDSNDPVVRMMMRRAQELGQSLDQMRPSPDQGGPADMNADTGGQPDQGGPPEQDAPPEQAGPAPGGNDQGSPTPPAPEQTNPPDNGGENP